MKVLLIIFLFPLLFGFPMLNSQPAITGQTAGENIVYTDLPDVTMSCDFLNTSLFLNLDINQDGTNDMLLQAFYYYYSHLNQMGTQTDIVPNAVTQLSVETNISCLQKHSLGDTIDKKLNWISDQGIFNTYSNTGTTECFKEEGYVGFRICLTDTIYGWIRFSATGDKSAASLTLYDYAYVLKPNSFPEIDTKSGFSYNNPVFNELMIRIPEKDINIVCKCLVYDISGRLLKSYNLTARDNAVNVSDLKRGLYLVSVFSGFGNRYLFKIIKE